MGGPRKLYVLFNYEEIKKSNNNIVLLGEVGAGKTTLFNKLVGGNFTTGKNCKQRNKNGCGRGDRRCAYCTADRRI